MILPEGLPSATSVVGQWRCSITLLLEFHTVLEELVDQPARRIHVQRFSPPTPDAFGRARDAPSMTGRPPNDGSEVTQSAVVRRSISGTRGAVAGSSTSTDRRHPHRLSVETPRWISAPIAPAPLQVAGRESPPCTRPPRHAPRDPGTISLLDVRQKFVLDGGHASDAGRHRARRPMV
jgi:hypothetical protein